MNQNERLALTHEWAARHARKLAAEYLAEGNAAEAAKQIDRAEFLELHAALSWAHVTKKQEAA